MPNVHFTAEEISRDDAMQLQRDAVLYPLVGNAPPSDTDEGLTSSLMETWRARVLELDEIGWDPPSIEQAYHCWPDFAPVESKVLPCELDYFCPFCYARKLTGHWLDFVDTLHQVNRDNSQEDSMPHHIITRSDRHVHNWDPEELPDALKEAHQNMADNIYSLHTIWAVAACTITPHGRKWQLDCQEVHIVPADYELNSLAMPEQLGRYSNVTTSCVLQVFGNLFQYPASLLSGPVEATSSILSAYAQVPPLTGFGMYDPSLPFAKVNYRSLCDNFFF